MRKHRIACAVALLAAPLGGIGSARGAEEPDTPSIFVTGTGHVASAPDLAEISAGVISQAQTAKDALAVNNEAMAALHEVLKERGVAAKDIQTASLTVAPQYSQPPRAAGPQAAQEFVPRIVAYQVTNTVRIKVRDLGKLGTLLDAVVQAGANQMFGISFGIDQPEKLLDQARKAAVADARRKAEQLAGEAGVVLGRPRHIREAGANVPTPRPMLGMARMAMAESAVPVASGEQELSVTVEVEFELQPPK